MTSTQKRDVTSRSTSQEWHPSLGSWCTGDGAEFRVWAPDKTVVEVVLQSRCTDETGYIATRFLNPQYQIVGYVEDACDHSKVVILGVKAGKLTKDAAER